MKRSSFRRAADARRRLSSLVWLQIVVLLVGQCSVGMANPLGGTVVGGSATIHSAGNTTTINQLSNRAIINWNGFSIAPGETTNFVQPGANAAILNRVTGAQMSQLMGTLQANGQVYLINPNGILIGSGATINVGGFTASTLDVNNADFMRGGDLTFSGNSQASVINRGNVTALGGDIYLIGAHVENHGVLRAVSGTVGLAAGQEVKLVDSSKQALVVRANGNSLGGTGVLNTGIIEGVRAELAANGGNVYALAINNKGTVRANGAVNRNGRILLTARGGKIANSGDLIAKNADGSGGEVTIDSASGASGVTNVSGRIDVSGVTGGRVEVLGDEVNLMGATIDAYGTGAGGVVLIGGDFQGNNPAIANATTTTVDTATTINADSTLLGNGGRVIVWGDDTTTFAGTITARGGVDGGNGGLVEVSGRSTLYVGGFVSTRAVNGQTGTLLLDPGHFDIDAGAGASMANSIGADTLTGAGFLADNDVVIATHFNGANEADIRVNAAVVWDADTDLTFLAQGNVRANADVLNTAGTMAGEGGNVNVIAGWDGVAQTPGTDGANPGAAFDFSAIVNNDATFGNNGGAVFIGDGVQTTGISVGSRFGETNVAAAALTLRGSITTVGAFAQLGFGNFIESIDSPITVSLTDGDGAPGNLTANAGMAERASVQVGHGRRFGFGEIAGDIRIIRANDVMFNGGPSDSAFAQLGHGGEFIFGNQTGEIRLDRVNNIDFNAGSGEFAYVQLGHGGSGADGTQTGNINILLANSVTFDGGPAEGASAQLGHGGASRVGEVQSAASQMGDISIVANNAAFTAGMGNAAYSQLGHGGVMTMGDQAGNIDVLLFGTDLSLRAGAGAAAYAQLGHGDASGNGFIGQTVGDINVIVAGSATLTGTGNTTTNGSPAVIGHVASQNSLITGNVVLAIDQIDPLADNGGRLFMNQFSAIDMGGEPNQVRIFGTRRLGNVLEDGASINGVMVDSTLPMGTRVGNRFNPNVEFTNWDHEQWGTGQNEYTLAQPGPYTAPFTFFYLGQEELNDVDIPVVTPPAPQFFPFPLPYDRFIRYSDYAYSIFQLFPNGPYEMYYGEWPARPSEDETTSGNSAHLYDSEDNPGPFDDSGS